jgi:hypothetical protein
MPEKSGKLDFFNPLKALYQAVTAIHGSSQKIKLLLFAACVILAIHELLADDGLL